MQCSIVQYSKVKVDSDCLRIDAEFFKNEYLSLDALLRNKPHKDLKDFGIVIYHPNEIKRNYVESGGVLFLRAQNVRPLEVDLDSNKVYITEEDAKKLSRNRIRDTDILVTRSGANFGQCAIYLESEKAVVSSHTFIVRTSHLNPFFLTVFLNTAHGRKLIDKGMYGAAQPEIAPFYLYRIPIPIFRNEFYAIIEKLYRQSSSLLVSSKALFYQAEQILLSELGLLNWKPKHQLSYIKNFSNVKTVDRMDAEYFQPMYEEAEVILSKHRRVSLDTLCNLINYGTVPTSPYCETGTPYIKGLNLLNGFISEEFDRIENTKHLPKKFYVKENDIVISQMGTVGKAGIVTKDQENFLFASFTIRIRIINYDFIDPYVLTLYINSVARKWYLMRKIAQASVRQNTDLPTIRSLLVPELDKQIQQRIRETILNSYKNKIGSKRLLDIAKQAVEIAIEKDEQTAMKYIEKHTEIN